MDSLICKNRGSNKVIEGLNIVDYSHMNEKKDLSVQIKTTDRIFMNKHQKGKLLINVCGSCGFVDMFVDNPHDLWEANLKFKQL